MFTKPSHHPQFWVTGFAKTKDEVHNWRKHSAYPLVHFLFGMVCAVVALPFGLMAAALAPIAVGFVKGVLDHYSGRDAGAANFAWTIAGAALVVASVRWAGLN